MFETLKEAVERLQRRERQFVLQALQSWLDNLRREGVAPTTAVIEVTTFNEYGEAWYSTQLPPPPNTHTAGSISSEEVRRLPPAEEQERALLRMAAAHPKLPPIASMSGKAPPPLIPPRQLRTRAETTRERWALALPPLPYKSQKAKALPATPGPRVTPAAQLPAIARIDREGLQPIPPHRTQIETT